MRPPDGRETATAVISALAALHGVWGYACTTCEPVSTR
ncbi:dihydropteroate synthase domain protein [Mycobacterium xenopi 4042]|uniref:Dihydropteroate synthase domain protein n=1 Tax=Mycobacterium xenopi 4042 TaxID=1299334 RepID=X7ZU15_MYCXE|nr:dihydropteroate synthase domain protein [Mycobacterium xenopi 4042]